MEPEADNTTPGMTLQEFLQILRRRRGTILQAFLIIAVAGTVLTLLTKPVYRASACLLVYPPAMSLSTADTNNPLAGIFQTNPPPSISTQVELLQSKPMMDRVAGRVSPSDITIKQIGDTDLIEVAAESTDPRAAASVPNILLQSYLNDTVSQNLGEIRNTKAFVQEQERDAHRRLMDTEQQLRVFKQQHHVGELTKDRDIQISRVAKLTDDLNGAKIDLAAVHSQLAEARNLLKGEPPVVSYDLTASNPNRDALQNEIDKLEIDRVAKTQKYGFTAQAAQIIAIDAQIAALKKKLAAEPAVRSTQSSAVNQNREELIGKITDMETRESSLQMEVAASRQELAQAKAQVGRFADWELVLANLAREHDAAQAMDNLFEQKLADLSLRERAQHAPARIVQLASTPTQPVRPKRLMSVIFSCLIGLFIGLCLALLQEFLDDRVNSVEEASRLLDLPTLGYVPAFAASDARLLPLMKGLSPASESYRVLRTNVHFASVDAPVRTLLVTSSNPGEGKSTTAANLAYAMALDGKTVVLVDTDLRRPSIPRLLNLPAVPGLTDIILGRAMLEEALQGMEDLPNLKILTAGSTPPNPSELLNSRTFRNIVDRLTDEADIVVFDSPPVLLTADAAILASQCDGVVFVVETGQTKKTASRRAAHLLRQARANILGVAYNKVRAAAGGQYYYYNYQYSTPPVQGKNGNGKKLPSGEENGVRLMMGSPKDED